MLTGRPPFQAATPLDTILQVLSEEPVPPRQLQPRLPRDLETICLKCLRKEPEKRYASAAALADDLRRYQEGRPVTARPVGQLARTWRWCQRNRAVAAMMASVVLLLTVIAVGGIVMSLNLNVALDDARNKKADAEAAGKQAQAERRMAQLREADALVGQVHGIRYSRRPGQRFEALAALKQAADIGHELGQPPEWFDRLRNEAIGALALPNIHITQTWDGFPPGTGNADVSDDFELYARTDRQGECWVQRINDNSEVAHLPTLGEYTRASFGPGRLLLLRGSGRCQLWNLSGPVPTLRLDEVDDREPENPLGHVAWDFSVEPLQWDFRRDGQLLVLKHRDESLAVYETDTLICRHRLPGSDWRSAAWIHPTEPLVARCIYEPRRDSLHVCDVRTGVTLVSVPLPWRHSGRGAWSPNGHAFAVADADSGSVQLYAFDSSKPSLKLTYTLDATGNGGADVQFNPAGDRVVTHGGTGIVNLFDANTGRLLFSTHSPSRSVGAKLRFDPSGRRLAAARVGTNNQQIGVWSVADGREYRALIHPGPGKRWYESGMSAVHPGGRLAVLGLRDGLALFDLETSGEIAFIPVSEGVANVCFDGFGNLFTTGPAGATRWPVVFDPARPRQMTVGPPKHLRSPIDGLTVATSRDGGVIAQVTDPDTAWVIHPGARRANNWQVK